jgi:DNA modification methylase
MTPYYDSGGVTIYHGSCVDVLPQIEAVDHVITDPPYAHDVYLRASKATVNTRAGWKQARRGSAVTGKSVSLEKMAAGDIGHIDALLAPVAVEIARIVKRWVIVFSDAETTHRWKSELEAAGLRYIRTGAWIKPDAMPQMTGDRPGVGFEPCTICHARAVMRWNGGGRLATWTHFISKGAARPDHPCPKPLPLMIELVSQFTDLGELILDPFGGSGTTAAAAKHNGRRCILIEMNEQFCELAARRVDGVRPGELFASPKARAIDLLGGAA